MFIGTVATQTGCSVEIIRHYEKIGLLSAAKRTPAGYRIYDDDDLKRLIFIRTARALGFGLSDIRELIDLSQQTADNCRTVDAIATKHLKEVRDKIDTLTAMAEELESVISQCQGGTIPKCGILNRLAGD